MGTKIVKYEKSKSYLFARLKGNLHLCCFFKQVGPLSYYDELK